VPEKVNLPAGRVDHQQAVGAHRRRPRRSTSQTARSKRPVDYIRPDRVPALSITLVGSDRAIDGKTGRVESHVNPAVVDRGVAAVKLPVPCSTKFKTINPGLGTSYHAGVVEGHPGSQSACNWVFVPPDLRNVPRLFEHGALPP